MEILIYSGYNLRSITCDKCATCSHCRSHFFLGAGYNDKFFYCVIVPNYDFISADCLSYSPNA